MKKYISKFYTLLFIVLISVGSYLIGSSNVLKKVGDNQSNIKLPEENKKVSSVLEGKFEFHNFHGQDLGTSGFKLEYLGGWYNNGQYFSPQKINYYDISSTDAPMYYDLVSDALIDTSDLKYQITTDKRYKPDSEVTIDGKKFKKYQLIDYSDKTNKVIIFVGPKVDILGSDYYLIFRWEEKPLGIEVAGNNPEVFEKIVESLKFTK